MKDGGRRAEILVSNIELEARVCLKSVVSQWLPINVLMFGLQCQFSCLFYSVDLKLGSYRRTLWKANMFITDW